MAFPRTFQNAWYEWGQVSKGNFSDRCVANRTKTALHIHPCRVEAPEDLVDYLLLGIEIRLSDYAPHRPLPVIAACPPYRPVLELCRPSLMLSSDAFRMQVLSAQRTSLSEDRSWGILSCHRSVGICLYTCFTYSYRGHRAQGQGKGASSSSTNRTQFRVVCPIPREEKLQKLQGPRSRSQSPHNPRTYLRVLPQCQGAIGGHYELGFGAERDDM
jgi:hypothetical protein